jgi:hypothetical protein
MVIFRKRRCWDRILASFQGPGYFPWLPGVRIPGKTMVYS